MTTAATGLPDRFTTPLYTVMEVAQYLDVPASSLAAWLPEERLGPARGNGNLGAAVLAQQFLAVIDKIASACGQPGPFVLAVSPAGLRGINL